MVMDYLAKKQAKHTPNKHPLREHTGVSFEDLGSSAPQRPFSLTTIAWEKPTPSLVLMMGMVAEVAVAVATGTHANARDAII